MPISPIDLREPRQLGQKRHTLKMDEAGVMLMCPFHSKHVGEVLSHQDQETSVATDYHYTCIFFKAELYYFM